jgi:hypothetical protein
VTECVDCIEADRVNNRPAPFPGPRCATDNTAHRRAKKRHRAAVRAQRMYGVTPEQQERQRAYQRGRCAICRIADGTAKALANDHNHETGEFRGLLCGPHNQMLGWLKDDPEAFFRAAIYLCHPVSRDALARRQLADGSWVWRNPIPTR